VATDRIGLFDAAQQHLLLSARPQTAVSARRADKVYAVIARLTIRRAEQLKIGGHIHRSVSSLRPASSFLAMTYR
jgi:hypothetical protein